MTATKRPRKETQPPPVSQIAAGHDDEIGTSDEADSTIESKSALKDDAATPCADQPLELRIEVLLLATDRPLTEARIAELLALSDAKLATAVREAIDSLNETYRKTGRTFRIEKLAGGYQILTMPSFGPVLSQLQRDRQQSRLTQAAMETLAIIAYRQPILRADIESIRGVACGEVLRTLLDRRLIKVVGRAEELGRPMLYGTTREFLKVFGLAGLTDLPPIEGENESKRKPAVKKEEPHTPDGDEQSPGIAD